MGSEKAKMLAGELYDAGDLQLAGERRRARELCCAFNATGAAESERRRALLTQLLATDTDANIHPPFFCDYGFNIKLGANAYFNVNCVVLDVMPVSVGINALFGPGVHIYTAMHPMNAAERRRGLESGKPVKIGDDVWVGGGAIICPGVSIGSRCVIGAGSVITRSIGDGLFAAGNPCRVIRRIED